jgi:hypothetical protein
MSELMSLLKVVLVIGVAAVLIIAAVALDTALRNDAIAQFASIAGTNDIAIVGSRDGAIFHLLVAGKPALGECVQQGVQQTCSLWYQVVRN